MRALIKNQSGDTLIEVVIAIVILGTILFSAYSLSSRAFSLGQSARERSQATQLLQQQAEALRGLRDSSSNWSLFRGKIQPRLVGTSQPDCQSLAGIDAAGDFSGRFHLEKSSNQWLAFSNEVKTDSPTFDGNDDFADFYTIWAEGCFVGDVGSDPNPDRFVGVIQITWPRVGTDAECSVAAHDPPCEVSQLHITLTDRALPAQ